MAQPQLDLKVIQSKRDDGKIQLNVTVPASLIEQAQAGAAMNLGQQNRIDLKDIVSKGNEAVISTVVEKVGEPQFQAFVNHYTMNALAHFAVAQQDLAIIMEPDVSSTEQVTAGKDFHFVAVVTLKPEYELSSYEPVTAKIPKIVVTDAEIDQQLVHFAETHAAQVEDKDGVVKAHSEVTFAIETHNEEGPLKAMTADSRVYRLGEGYLPADFDENLIGMKVGETKTFDFGLPDTNPDAYLSESEPKVMVTTTVTLNQVMKRVIPAITDAWVEATVPEAKDVDGLREMVREQGMQFKQRELEGFKMMAVASELGSRLQGSIDDELYEHTSRELMANLQAQLQQGGTTFEDFLKQQGLGEQEFSMQMMLQTRETLRQGLALDALARHLKMKVTEEDIEAALDNMAPGQQEMARRQFESSGRGYVLAEAALRTKANKWLVETATFETVDQGPINT